MDYLIRTTDKLGNHLRSTHVQNRDQMVGFCREMLRMGYVPHAHPFVGNRIHRNAVQFAETKRQSVDVYNDRVYAECEDGIVRRVKVLEADTFFTRPASVTIKGRYVKGFVTAKTLTRGEVALDDDPALWQFVETARD